MACIESVKQCITQGNDWFLDITITQDGVINDDTGIPENPIDLTGSTITLVLKETLDGASVIAPTVTIGDALNGQVSISLTAAQTETLITTESSRLLYGAPQITYSDGTVEDLFQLDIDVHKSWN